MSANIMTAHIQLRKLIVGIEYSQRTKSIASLTVGRLLFAPAKTKHAWLISTNCLQFGFLGTRSNRMWWTKQNKSVLVEIHGATLLSGLQAALKYLLYLTKREKKSVAEKKKAWLSSFALIFCYLLLLSLLFKYIPIQQLSDRDVWDFPAHNPGLTNPSKCGSIPLIPTRAHSPNRHTNIEQAHIWGHGKIFLCCGFIKTYIFTKQTHKKTLSIILQPLLCRGKTEPEGLNDWNNKHRLNKSL